MSLFINKLFLTSYRRSSFIAKNERVIILTTRFVSLFLGGGALYIFYKSSNEHLAAAERLSKSAEALHKLAKALQVNTVNFDVILNSFVNRLHIHTL